MIEQITKINAAINGVVWGVPMLVLIIATGIIMTVGMKFFQLVHFKEWMNETFLAIFKKKHVRAHTAKHEKSISQFQALSTALAATYWCRQHCRCQQRDRGRRRRCGILDVEYPPFLE